MKTMFVAFCLQTFLKIVKILIYIMLVVNGNCLYYLRGAVIIYGHLFQLCWVPLGVLNLRKPPVYK